MGMSPMGWYLSRNADGCWIGVVAGRPTEPGLAPQPVRGYDEGPRTRRIPLWVRLMDTLHESLVRPNHH